MRQYLNEQNFKHKHDIIKYETTFKSETQLNTKHNIKQNLIRKIFNMKDI